MTRLIGRALIAIGRSLTLLGMRCTGDMIDVVVSMPGATQTLDGWRASKWTREPDVWTAAHEQPRITSRGPEGWQ
jgi:hypothetical protein